MPLRCIHCSKEFPVSFSGTEGAKEFRNELLQHIHQGKAPVFVLVDCCGIEVQLSKDDEVKEEERLLNQFSKWVQ